MLRCRENIEKVSTTPSDRGRPISSLRVQYEGDKVQDIVKDMGFVEKRFRQDVEKTSKQCPPHPVIERIRFPPFGRPNTMNILKFIAKDMVFVEQRFW